ncbi:Uncharacterised protein [Vibrio cholerae]|nr:Uncharacterised protein [Vibrio cholerae]
MKYFTQNLIKAAFSPVASRVDRYSPYITCASLFI